MKSLILALGLIFSISGNLANANSGAAEGGMTGWQAFSEMQNGNMRFYEGKLKHPDQDIPRRESQAGGQKPHTIILSCSDSRVPPEVVFDQGLGDVFVVRLAGNVVTTEAIASIEYAIEHLGSKLLLVLGHESCGAVGAAIGSKKGVSVGSESLDVLVGKIRGNLSAQSISMAAEDKSFRYAVKENVSANLTDLYKKSSIVREAVEKKGLILAQGVYSLKTGRVDFWNVGERSSFSAGIENELNAPKMKDEHITSEEIKTATPPAGKSKKQGAVSTEPAHSDHH